MINAAMISETLQAFKRFRNQCAKIVTLRNNNPRVVIEPGVIILGDPSNILIGEGSYIKSGAIIDMENGGSLRLGCRCSVYSGAILAPYGGRIKVGDDCGFQHYTILYGHGGLTMGNLVRFAANCMVIPANHGIKNNKVPINQQPLSKIGITLGNDIWVGSGSTILDGVEIGDGAVVAAGAVVNCKVDRDTIVGGVPAKLLKHRTS